jgi:hypothetical protein
MADLTVLGGGGGGHESNFLQPKKTLKKTSFLKNILSSKIFLMHSCENRTSKKGTY